jgi:hypothetical protein
MFGLLNRLDDAAFLSLRTWEFSFRSLRRRYALTFLAQVLLRHPAKAISGMSKYRRLVQESLEQSDITMLFEGPEDDLVSRLAAARRDLLVAVGFCQKPVDPPCPAGRPNHDCVFLEELNLEEAAESVHEACFQCKIRTIGLQALRAGACMHIMTSALDIARDVMIPSAKHQLFSYAVMCLCPFSVQVIQLPLLICGMEGFLVGYSSGNCLDYEQWLRADRGIKKEITALSASAHEKVVTLLDGLAEQRETEGVRYTRFSRRGNIYVPGQ